MKNLLLNICKGLVDEPEKLEVNVIQASGTHIFEVHAVKNDVGKIIGKQGKTAHAIRTIMNAAGSKEKKRVVIEIIE